FGFRRVGPRVPTEDGDFVIIGGVQQLYVTADYVIPIAKELGLKAVAFFDIGNVFNDGEDLSVDPSDLRKDFGFGVRWLSPLGPIRLDVGFPIGDKLPGEDDFEIQFTVGTLF
ncbi:MAG: BamA/TamA family outer membrane protein, partial [Candidatus Dadabacteria bacterium]|nr:BamA/TamA family outer membrane protein [Candidatus Dadabacteria bacterium]NIQ14344.1 BamA/TamA family outer membrane protein [Candidatus Dadabacteria bacterium]